MAEVSAQARIAAPAEKVWHTLTDSNPHTQWSTTHTGFPDGGPEPPEAGATYRENMKLMSRCASSPVSSSSPGPAGTTRKQRPPGGRDPLRPRLPSLYGAARQAPR
ncbi:hypothetical protein [Actinacidiphila glaucinigra]|uniref:hypothetical protein n=1 Tax=Actinacidiphila glaucinigra TaxID=235986 RepID=UPI003D93E7AA